MADSIRQQIMAAVVARFEGIKKASGYKTDLGLSIAHWRPVPWQDADLPACTIRDTSAENLPATTRSFNNVITVDLDISCSSGSTTITDAYGIIADVFAAIGTDPTWGDLAFTTHVPENEIAVDQEDKIIAGVTIRMIIEYSAARWAF